MRAPRFLIPPPTAWRARRARCLSDPACGQIEFPMDLEDGFATWLAVMARYAETAVQNGGEDPARACARARGRLTCRATAGADDALVAACKVARRGGGAGLAFEDLLMDLSDGRWPPPPFPLAFPYTRQPFSYPPANCILYPGGCSSSWHSTARTRSRPHRPRASRPSATRSRARRTTCGFSSRRAQPSAPRPSSPPSTSPSSPSA